MTFNCLKARATLRRQFTFYHYLSKAFWLNDLLVLNLKMSTAKVSNCSYIWIPKKLYLCYKI